MGFLGHKNKIVQQMTNCVHPQNQPSATLPSSHAGDAILVSKNDLDNFTATIVKNAEEFKHHTMLHSQEFLRNNSAADKKKRYSAKVKGARSKKRKGQDNKLDYLG